mgnify:FL=1
MKLRALCLSVLLWVVLVGGGAFVSPVAADTPDCSGVSYAGSGTSADPYQVGNVDQLQCLNQDLDAHYELVGDIDASKTSTWNSESGFSPIGGATAFTGTLDGNGHTVTGLSVDRDFSNDIGLFGQVGASGVVTDLTLATADVTGNSNVGALVGVNHGTVEKVSVDGTVTGSYTVGGLAGRNHGTVTRANASSTVGISGGEGTPPAGGLVGYNDGTISKSYATGDVSGTAPVVRGIGASAGHSGGRAYQLSSTVDTGGLVGDNDGTIDQAYATGAVSGGGETGGLVATNGAGSTVTASYWDTDSTGQDTSAGSATGLTTSEMQGSAAQTNMAGLDFDGTWRTRINDYPALAWQGVRPAPSEVPAVRQVIEYNGNIEVVFSTGVVANGTRDAITSAADWTVYVDGTAYGTGDFTVTATDGTAGTGRDVTVTLTPDATNGWDDPTPSTPVTVAVPDIQPYANVADGEYVATPGNQSVRTTSQVVTGGGPDGSQSVAARVYQGEVLALGGTQGEALAVVRVDGQAVFDSNYGNATVFALNTSDLTVGATYRVDYGTSDDQFVTVSGLELNATVPDTTITAGDDLSVDISTLRGGEPAIVELVDDGEVLNETTVTLRASETVTATFTNVHPAGTYNVTVTDAETGKTVRTDPVTVEKDLPGTVRLNQTVYSQERGDVATLGIELSNTDTATVTIGTVGENNWAQNVTVEDSNGDGVVTFAFNTYTAGTDGKGNYLIYSFGNDSVTNVGRPAGAFDPDTPAADTLAADDYPIAAVAGKTPASETDDGADAVGTLSLRERSTMDITTYTAPGSRLPDIGNVSAIESLLENGNVTETSEVGAGDTLLFKLDASGLEGVLQNHTDNAYANDTAAFLAEAPGYIDDGSDTHAWDFIIKQTNPRTNAVPYDASLTVDNTDLHADANDDDYWLVVDTEAVPEFSSGDQLRTDFTTLDGDDINDGNTTVPAFWEYSPREATVDANADTDSDGAADEVTVQKASDQQITGTATLAPGTELAIRIIGTDAGAPFVKPLTTRVRSDGTWTATADFSDNAVGANFTVNVRHGSEQLIEENVDGRIARPPRASVTFDDQESFGEVVEVDSVTLSAGGFVALHRDNANGDVIGTSAYIESGSEADLDIVLDETMSEDATLVAMVHQDTDGDQRYEFEFGSTVDEPYTENGSAKTDAAEITVANPQQPATTTTDTATTTTMAGEETTTGDETTTGNGLPTTTTTDGGDETTTDGGNEETAPEEEDTTTEASGGGSDADTTTTTGPGFGFVLTVTTLVAIAFLAVRRAD